MSNPDKVMSSIILNAVWGKLNRGEVKVVIEVRDATPSPPPPPPNTPEPQQQQNQVVSSETCRLVRYFDTLDEEDCLSAAERMERVNREPIPPNATCIPGGAESDEEE